MPQEAVTGILVIRPHLKGLHQTGHRLHDCVGFLILDEAGIHPDNPVTLRLIDARVSVPSAVRRHHAVYLIAVMIRVLHANHRLHSAERSQQTFLPLLLSFQLLLIRQVYILAAAAFLLIRADRSLACG